MDTVYAWDEMKQKIVHEKHNVSFWEVIGAFDDERCIDTDDPQGHEGRWHKVARTPKGRLLQIIYEDGEEFTEAGSPITRIITAFDAGEHWRADYERGG
jgi:uncharacterized DUF497 family protein